MPISGLVVTLGPPGPDARAAAAWLNTDARFAVGVTEPEAPRRLPVTLDTPDQQEDKRTWEQLQDHPGVAFVDVACVFFEEAQALPNATATASEAHSTEADDARSRP